MKTQRFIIKIVVGVTAVFVLSNLSGCGSSQSIVSSWNKQEIKIDGDPSEWLSIMKQIPDKKVSVGFRNDDKFLYLCLMTEDRTKIFQLLRGGFVVWFETESSEYKTYGVRYPLPIDFSKQTPMNREAGIKEPGEMDKNLGQREDLEKLIQIFFQRQNELEVINKDKFPLTALSLPNKEGTEAKFGVYREMLVYELKVPLAVGGDYSFSAGAIPGDNLKIRFETESLAARSMGEAGESGERGQGPGGMPPSGGGGMRGGGMRGGGRSGGGRAGGMGGGLSSGNIDLSVEIKLAAQQINK
jgi:hypothetical protein